MAAASQDTLAVGMRHRTNARAFSSAVSASCLRELRTPSMRRAYSSAALLCLLLCGSCSSSFLTPPQSASRPVASSRCALRPLTGPQELSAAIRATRCVCRRVSSISAAAKGRGSLQVKLVGVGSAAPDTRVSNGLLEEFVDTSDEWIAKRTGIRSRHLLAPGEGLSGLASSAAQRALEMAGVDAAEVDLVILATSSPDDLFGDAAGVARAVGATEAVAFDLTAACSGFLFGLNTAAQYIHNGAYSTALVIGADALSRWVDWSDRNTCVLFGDGAGAVVLRAADAPAEAGLLGFAMHSNGAGRSELKLGYDGTARELQPDAARGSTKVTRGAYAPIAMNGREVYRRACTLWARRRRGACSDGEGHSWAGTSSQRGGCPRCSRRRSPTPASRRRASTGS